MSTLTKETELTPKKHARDFADIPDIRRHFAHIAHAVRSGDLRLGRSYYVLSLMQGVIQAIHCGYPRIAAVELGVGSGGGLRELCCAAKFFTADAGIDIDIFGFDCAAGLPRPVDYRDHPEVWEPGEYAMGNPDRLRAKLPPNAHLIIGDVRDTIPGFEPQLRGQIGFVSIDLDFYSSTRDAMSLFRFAPDRYLPAVPLYVDDVENCICFNEWCGVSGAIREFNQTEPMRKIVKTPFNIPAESGSFHVCHVLDHPIRNGSQKPRFPLHIHSL